MRQEAVSQYGSCAPAVVRRVGNGGVCQEKVAERRGGSPVEALSRARNTQTGMGLGISAHARGEGGERQRYRQPAR